MVWLNCKCLLMLDRAYFSWMITCMLLFKPCDIVYKCVFLRRCLTLHVAEGWDVRVLHPLLKSHKGETQELCGASINDPIHFNWKVSTACGLQPPQFLSLLASLHLWVVNTILWTSWKYLLFLPPNYCMGRFLRTKDKFHVCLCGAYLNPIHLCPQRGMALRISLKLSFRILEPLLSYHESAWRMWAIEIL